DAGHVVLDARERSQDGDSYVYDLDVRDPEGALVERWEGLTLRAVRKRSGAGPWVPAMLGSYLERALERALGGSRAVVVEPDPPGQPVGGTAERRRQTALALGRAAGAPVELRHRPDGKPEVDGIEVSASHTRGLTLAVAGAGVLTCDVETVLERTEEDWRDLLGPELTAVRDLVAADLGEPLAVAATRVWSAVECIRKTGSTTQALALHSVTPDGWVLLSAGRARIGTWVTTVHGNPDPVVFAVLTGEDD
ncbi:MAG TPA: polyketide synthase dehydratase domain-containing protein, partial [Pseudonocardia sp.]|nr:polyketide synthase dehydratase domain-containing protein [Pseudonocardia sp.]